MNRWYLSDIAEALGGVILTADTAFEGASIDSRTIKRGELFIALKGENFDGNEFIDKVESKGASGIVTNNKNIFTSLPILHVTDTNDALAKLAAWIREQFVGKIVGITGSCGKTTLKEMLLWLLESRYNTMATLANHNNQIGVPLTLCELDSEHEIAIIEMGATKKGDIDYIAALAKPDIAIITNIAHAHLAGMHNLATVAAVKGEIFNHLSHNGTAVISDNSPYAGQWKKQLDKQTLLTFGYSADANYQAKNITMTKAGMQFSLHVNLADTKEQLNITLPLWGKHNVNNALAAIAIAHNLNLPLTDIEQVLKELVPAGARLEIMHSKCGARIFNDSYNANPDAMQAALDVVTDDTWSGPKIAILGDMLDLGDYALQAHQQIGKYTATVGIDHLFSVGKLSLNMSNSFVKHMPKTSSCQHFNTNAELISALGKLDRSFLSDANILIKASRNACFETIVDFLINLSP
jgi:UDP-N-acetylmuramoyl-tripeptide--D-alanyl-D-alanine ligase